MTDTLAPVSLGWGVALTVLPGGEGQVTVTLYEVDAALPDGRVPRRPIKALDFPSHTTAGLIAVLRGLQRKRAGTSPALGDAGPAEAAALGVATDAGMALILDTDPSDGVDLFHRAGHAVLELRLGPEERVRAMEVALTVAELRALLAAGQAALRGLETPARDYVTTG